MTRAFITISKVAVKDLACSLMFLVQVLIMLSHSRESFGDLDNFNRHHKTLSKEVWSPLKVLSATDGQYLKLVWHTRWQYLYPCSSICCIHLYMSIITCAQVYTLDKIILLCHVRSNLTQFFLVPFQSSYMDSSPKLACIVYMLSIPFFEGIWPLKTENYIEIYPLPKMDPISFDIFYLARKNCFAPLVTRYIFIFWCFISPVERQHIRVNWINTPYDMFTIEFMYFI